MIGIPKTAEIKVYKESIYKPHETPALNSLIRKLEMVELAMHDWNNGSKKFDPVQTYYSSLILAVKSLCENENICSILLSNKNRLEETTALSILRDATKDVMISGRDPT
jgi:hypothetical protein